jgi:UDP-glucuronate decarboxylase
MRFIIAGGAGFIGSNLVEYLLKNSRLNHVTVLDNFSTGKLENIKHFQEDYPNRLKIVNHDVTSSYSSQNLLYDLQFKPDIIYNLACPASPVHYQKRPISTTLTSVLGTYNLLSLALDTNARFVQASTSEVYGNPQIHPQDESYLGYVNCFGPRACYDEGKRCAESLVYDFKSEGVDVRIVRIFNTYGPKMDANDGRVVSNFIVQALKGEPITIYGTGNQTRSFCYVDDLIRGLLTVCSSSYKSPVNLGNPGEFTMLELAQKIITITNSNSILTFKDLPKDDPERRKPDITLVKSLGWEPSVDLDTGLLQTIDYFRKVLYEQI